jgi:CMP-2-keto-3-deoxyoctulosonic acid synthetase
VKAEEIRNVEIHACPVCGHGGYAQPDHDGAVIVHLRRIAPCRLDNDRHLEQLRELYAWWPILIEAHQVKESPDGVHL